MKRCERPGKIRSSSPFAIWLIIKLEVGEMKFTKFSRVIAPLTAFAGLVAVLLLSFSVTQVKSPDKIQELARQTGADRAIATEKNR
jgi:hypothetical protein